MKKMKIGKLTLINNLILAPMAGYSVPALRRLAAENGVGLTVTEMVSVKGLIYLNQKTEDLLKTSEAEKIKCVQLFGGEPDDFAKALSLHALDNFDIIDINMGCPVKKIVSNGEGSALISDPLRAAAIVRETVLAAGGRAVTVKTRLGRDLQSTVDFINRLQGAGAKMIALHPRTPAQMYAGTADYYAFEYVRQRVDVPMALSGDITLDNYKKAEEAKPDFFMIGRGAVANPAIFAQILTQKANVIKNNKDFADNQGHVQKQASAENQASAKSNKDFAAQSGHGIPPKGELILRLLDYMHEDFGAEWAVKAFRKFLPYVLKGEKCPKDRRHSMNFIAGLEELKAELRHILMSK